MQIISKWAPSQGAVFTTDKVVIGNAATCGVILAGNKAASTQISGEAAAQRPALRLPRQPKIGPITAPPPGPKLMPLGLGLRQGRTSCTIMKEYSLLQKEEKSFSCWSGFLLYFSNGKHPALPLGNHSQQQHLTRQSKDTTGSSKGI